MPEKKYLKMKTLKKSAHLEHVLSRVTYSFNQQNLDF